jgi:hypothetical protein
MRDSAHSHRDHQKITNLADTFGMAIALRLTRVHIVGANGRSTLEEATMRVSTRGLLIPALLIGISVNVYAQGAGGGGAAGGQGGTGMSKPNAGGSTDTVSGASGVNTMAPSGSTTSHKKTHKKSSAGMAASAPAPGSGGN